MGMKKKKISVIVFATIASAFFMVALLSGCTTKEISAVGKNKFELYTETSFRGTNNGGYLMDVIPW